MVIKICRTNCRNTVINQHGLLVHEALGVAVEFYTAFTSLSEIEKCCHVNQLVIRFIGDKDTYINTAQAGKLQCRDNGLIRYEIGAGDPDTIAVRIDGVNIRPAVSSLLQVLKE